MTEETRLNKGEACRLAEAVQGHDAGTEVVVTETPEEGDEYTVVAHGRYTADDQQFEVRRRQLEPYAEIGCVLGPRQILMRMAMAEGTRESTGDQFEVGAAVGGGAVYVYSRTNGRFWVLGPGELIDLALDNGLMDAPEGFGAEQRPEMDQNPPSGEVH